MTSDVAESWSLIISWMRENAPPEELILSAPATDDKIAAFASQLECEIPSDFIGFFKLLDGAEYNASEQPLRQD